MRPFRLEWVAEPSLLLWLAADSWRHLPCGRLTRRRDSISSSLNAFYKRTGIGSSLVPSFTIGASSLLTVRKIIKVIRDPAQAFALLNAQLQMRGRARVPLSVRLHGKVHIKGSGDITFGEGITLTGSVVPLELISHPGAHLRIGDHTFINYGSSISAHQRVEIGAHCLLGHYTLILDNNQHDLMENHVLPPSAPVVIKDHVWIGSKVTILPGVHIGRNSAIGAGSVVTRDIPSYSLAVGNPARVVRRLDHDDTMAFRDPMPALPEV